MAKSPKEMELAILSNLKAKSGRDLAEWRAWLGTAAPSDRKVAVTLLKEAGLGTIQATVVAAHHFAPEKGAFSEYQNPDELVAALFAPFDAVQREAYEQLRATVLAKHPEWTSDPCKTYIPFSWKRQFMVVKPSKEGLLIGLTLPLEIPFEKGLMPPRKSGWTDRVTHQLVLSGPADLAPQVYAWIEEAGRAAAPGTKPIRS